MAEPPVLHQADNIPMERRRRGRLPLALGLSAALLGLAAAGGSIYALLEHGVLPGAAIRDSGTSSAPAAGQQRPARLRRVVAAEAQAQGVGSAGPCPEGRSVAVVDSGDA